MAPTAKRCTHPSVVSCLALFLFLATSKGPSTSGFPSESLHNFQAMMPLRVKGEALLAPWRARRTQMPFVYCDLFQTY